jgi:hypothetical protein
MDDVVERRGVRVLVCAQDGPAIAGPQDAVDLIGAAFGRAEVVAIPAARLGERFFDLRTGVAGEIMQKFVNYRLRLAVVGTSARTRGPAGRCATWSRSRTGAGTCCS